MHKKIQVANASIEQVIAIAKMKMQNLLSRDLKSAVKTIVGTCGTLGILVENKPAKEVEKEIDEGIYDKEIKHEATEMSAEKRERLATYFAEVKAKQEKQLKLEEAAAQAAKEQAEAEAKTSVTATTAAAAKPEAEVKASKTEAKK